MCLILFGYKVHPKHDLVVMANRDEFYKRPTVAANWWEDEPDILAGRDLVGAGSWFGVNKSGRFAALTNYRDGFKLKENAPTRGTIVSGFLKNEISPEEYIRQLDKQRDAYNGYNVLLYDGDRLFHYSNMDEGYTEITPGIYGLSNHLLDTAWPKVKKGKEALGQLLKQDQIEADKAFKALQNYGIATDDKLPNTNISIEWERMLSPMFIKTNEYGTRCSTFLTIAKSGKIKFEERSYAPTAGRSKFEFQTISENTLVTL